MSFDAGRFLGDLRKIVDRIDRLTAADLAAEKNDIARDLEALAQRVVAEHAPDEMRRLRAG
jgi:hypothetical protein